MTPANPTGLIALPDKKPGAVTNWAEMLDEMKVNSRFNRLLAYGLQKQYDAKKITDADVEMIVLAHLKRERRKARNRKIEG